MRAVLWLLGFLCGVAYGGGDDVAEITARLAAMKSIAHRSLTATKDVSPLIGRIDKDLLVLEAKKQALAKEKSFLLQRRDALQISVCEKKNEQNTLQVEQSTLDAHWEQYLGQLRSFVAQQSIQAASQEVAQSVSRATLLAQKFEPAQNLLGFSEPLVMVAEDVRG